MVQEGVRIEATNLCELLEGIRHRTGAFDDQARLRLEPLDLMLPSGGRPD